MNKLKNIGTSFLLFLLPVISFAQRAERGVFDEGYKEQGIEPGDTDFTPIDQYEIALIIMAVSIIAYFVYKQYAKRQA